MSEELQDYDDQLQEILAEIKRTLEKDVAKLTGKAKIEKCEFVKNRINRARQLLKSYNVELRELPQDSRKAYDEKSKDYDAQITRFQDDVQWATAAATRDDLLGGNKARNADEMTTKQLIDTAKNVQDKSKESTQRTNKILEQTIQIGNDTAAKLSDQTKQIEGVDKNIDTLESNLKRADKQIRVFLRRMATDKVVMALVVLVVIGIIAAVVSYSIRGRLSGQTGNPLDVFGDSANSGAVSSGFSGWNFTFF